MDEPLLAARSVSVRFETPQGPLTAVRGVDLDIRPGEVVGLVGESGSGKSAFARALLRMNAPPFTAARATVTGAAWLRRGGRAVDLVVADEATMRDVRARDVAMIFQDALSGLNPVMRIGAQLAEALLAAEPRTTRAEAEARAVAMLCDVRIADAPTRARYYPHQLSGGQRQRAMIAIAMLRDPALLIADEPTTALDMTVQARVLDILRDLQRRRGMAVLFISHDLAIVERLADRVVVMYARAGRRGGAGRPPILRAAPPLHRRPSAQPSGAAAAGRGTDRRGPRSARAWFRLRLPAALSAGGTRLRGAAAFGGGGPLPPASTVTAAIVLSGATVRFGGSLLRRAPPFTALDSVDLSVGRGEIHGLVGESGSGKTTLGRVVLGLQTLAEGSARVAGETISTLRGPARRAFRRRVQCVFQDSAASLDPRMTLGASIREGLDVNRIGDAGPA
jgi:peptide/nickel transport system ATP-binding protein